ncbi:hypothetical protein CNMCM7691_007755 [Aspergillus felis]|uniref:Uncharacterized protein n=1 Tax=Aspergillus felis TaxID=1287682 RepID=A0A8H6QT81_9EURO|nr:hypothetical protein CNMCM7691_007755 [Aspergillus felis]
MTPFWLGRAIGAIGLLLSADSALRRQERQGSESSPVLATAVEMHVPWLATSQDLIQTLFYEFSLYDQVDDPDTLHRIYACTSYGADWCNLPQSKAKTAAGVLSVNLTYDLGWWVYGALAATDISTISKQMRHYLESEQAATKSNTIPFARSGLAISLYIT